MISRLAIVLTERQHQPQAEALAGLLAFFGVEHRTIFADASAPGDAAFLRRSGSEIALLASADAFQRACRDGLIAPGGFDANVLIYAGPGPECLEEVCRTLFGKKTSALRCTPAEKTDVLAFSDRHREICGPFSGLTIKGVTSAPTGVIFDHDRSDAVITAPSQGEGAVLLCRVRGKHEAFVSMSRQILDIRTFVHAKFFDIKKHLFELLPFILFIKRAFSGQIFRAHGVHACLVVDDPRLICRYGNFDYRRTFKEMERTGFTTSVAFIPWNHRRSDPAVVKLAQANASRFTICIHGCNHTKAEFAAAGPAALDSLAATAVARMESHLRTYGMPYDKVMVFPQGVFSAESARGLKHNNYWAAVNSDICASNDRKGVPIAEVMDLAITRYDGFPIITRRYFWHGLENFAFDILLEKPCLIVTHQQDFKDDFRHVREGLDALAGLNARLEWSRLGDVVRSLYKFRPGEGGQVDFRAFSNSCLIRNPLPSEIEASILKREPDFPALDSVFADEARVRWSKAGTDCSISLKLAGGASADLRFVYRKDPSLRPAPKSFINDGKILLRRYATEIRDRYLS